MKFTISYIRTIIFTLETLSLTANCAAAIMSASLFVSSIYSLFTSSSSVSSVKFFLESKIREEEHKHITYPEKENHECTIGICVHKKKIEFKNEFHSDLKSNDKLQS